MLLEPPVRLAAVASRTHHYDLVDYFQVLAVDPVLLELPGSGVAALYLRGGDLTELGIPRHRFLSVKASDLLH